MDPAVGLQELVHLAIGSPEVGAVNFNVLHKLLHEIIKNLKTEEAADGGREMGEAAKTDTNNERKRGETEPAITSLMDDIWNLKEMVKVKDEDVSKSLTLMQDLMEEIKSLKESNESLQIQVNGLREGGPLQDQQSQRLHEDELHNTQNEDLKELLKDTENIHQRLDKLEEVLHPAMDQLVGPTATMTLQTSETTQDKSPPHPISTPDSDISSTTNVNVMEALQRLEKLCDENVQIVERLEALERFKADRSEPPKDQGGTGLIVNVDVSIRNQSQSRQHVTAGSESVDRNMETLSQTDRQVESLKATVFELGKEFEKMKEKQEHEINKLEQSLANHIHQMLEQKADKYSLKWKVNLTEFEANIGQLKAMIQDLQTKKIGLEEWQRILEKVNMEMPNKMDRVDLNSFKRQLEEEWRVISKKLQDHLQEYETDGAAVTCKPLNTKFRCLCCNRLVKAPSPPLNKLPSLTPVPTRRSNQQLAALYTAQRQQRR